MMLPRHRLYRNDIDSIVGLLNIRRRLRRQGEREYVRESPRSCHIKTGLYEVMHRVRARQRSILEERYDEIHVHMYTYTRHAHIHTQRPLSFVHRVSHRINDILVILCGARSARRIFAPCSTAGYNDRPCCVEIFKVSL